MVDEFWEGFEKEAKLKAALLAGLLASTPMTAVAGSTGKAVSHAAKAANKQWGKAIKNKAPKVVQNIRNKTSKGVSGSAGKLSIKDLQKLHYSKGNFQASLGGGGNINAKYNIGKGLDIVGKKGGGGTYAGFNYKKEF